MPDEIIYPSINLFLYDLKDGLGQDEAKIAQNCEQFCKKIYPDLNENTFEKKYAQIREHQHTDAEAIELLETRYRKFPQPLDGWYYPLQLADTYALQVNYSGKLDANGNFNDDAQYIDDSPFQNLKKELSDHISQQTGTIGQTWLVWGKLTSDKTDVEIEQIAQKFYTQIVNNYDWKRDFIGKGSFLGGTLFELWYRPEILNKTGKEFWDDFREKSQHLLIWLFPYNLTPKEMREKVQAVYYDWLRLFQYRHKVIWSYYQSRFQKAILKREYVEIQPSIKLATELPRQFQQNKLKLNQLQKILADNLINLSDYTIALNNLENQIRTIETNLKNYQARLDEMNNKDAQGDLKFLQDFYNSEIYAKKYQRQLDADYANLSPGLTLLQNLNSSIQGIIELEQTKSDRTLNTTIAIAGIGLATSQIASAVILAQPSEKQNPLTFRTEIFFWSLGIGAIASLITWFCLRLFRGSHK
jgi:hypothetical protein